MHIIFIWLLSLGDFVLGQEDLVVVTYILQQRPFQISLT